MDELRVGIKLAIDNAFEKDKRVEASEVDWSKMGLDRSSLQKIKDRVDYLERSYAKDCSSKMISSWIRSD